MTGGAWGVRLRGMVDEIPTFDELVDILRERLFDADALKPSDAHSFKEPMADYADVVGDNFYFDAFAELDSLGHIGVEANGMGNDAHARLSADGRFVVRQERGI